ncbi:TetR family transcriptional regulator [Klebsiella pneumoniae]|nr:TetR family transcriptional regulator [Klebsiella pneumoniae]EKL1170171.1 TetR family transcriptional regulator [Klebsiella pneumoniae]EKL1178785.1 TetR family transcriptional regulator [Klebsiella pneumoniae]EKP7304945.1 TetR family transcriptional regulator [Klebsiella pneumoniae]EKZ6264644.1 TetR family transcriptional regulator [Klebsiella pneumoniae]
MHYLQRDARREGIMQAAMRLALRGGFAAMTVRQIAREAQVAAGQLHHHFTSIGELKAQVFIRLIREMLDMPLVAEDASWRERLFSMIGSEDGRLEPYIRLWREGLVLADSDPDIKAAYLLTMNMWHAETVAIIEQGLASGEFRSAEPAADIAWRFIALVCGLDGIYALDTQALDEAAFSRYVNKMITLELF